MATSTSNNAKLMRANLLSAIVMGEKTPKQTWHDKLVDKKLSTRQAYEESALVTPLGLPSITAEYGTPPTEDISTPYSKTHTPVKRMLHFRVSSEALGRDHYGLMKQYGTMMRTAFTQAKEIAAAAYLNYATSSTILSTPAGQPLASTAHPIELGGTTANTPATGLTLGIQALETVLYNLMMQVSHKNQPQPVSGPYILELHPKNLVLAQRLIGSSQRPETDINDKNVIVGRFSEIIASPYFTHEDWWCVRTADGSEGHRFFLGEGNFEVTGLDYEKDNDSYKASAKESYLFDVFDWRGTYYQCPT